MAQFSLATTEKGYTSKTTCQVVPDKTEWHNIVLWRGLAEIAEKYIHKGLQIFIQGKLRTRSYDDKQGVKRYITEIEADMMQMLGGKASNNTDTANAQQARVNNGDDGMPF